MTGQNSLYQEDTIVGIATAPGKGAVGIIRISGKQALTISQEIIQTSELAEPRKVVLKSFYLENNQPIDKGLYLYFKAPFSFTGEDVVELQTHGGQAILSLLLKRCVQLGARLAEPGEFSQRAFLNDKMDLTQAEAIADLIEAQTEDAAKNAVASLQGKFSEIIQTLSEQTLHLRMYVEAAMDFPDEDVDFIENSDIKEQIDTVIQYIDDVYQQAKQGKILQEGITVVLAGEPNAGKSTLLNALTGEDTAIVTDIAGTTRDTLQEYIQLDGVPLKVIDTAGLRETDDIVEKQGIERAKQAIEKASIVLWLVSAEQLEHTSFEALQSQQQQMTNQFADKQIITLLTKTDVVNKDKVSLFVDKFAVKKDRSIILPLSSKTGDGMEHFTQVIKDVAGLKQTSEGLFSARQRHLDALELAQTHLKQTRKQLTVSASGDLMAEDLKLAHQALGTITGEVTPDDLLGHIFSSFCIGK